MVSVANVTMVIGVKFPEGILDNVWRPRRKATDGSKFWAVGCFDSERAGGILWPQFVKGEFHHGT
jgi:hypothetical protein